MTCMPSRETRETDFGLNPRVIFLSNGSPGCNGEDATAGIELAGIENGLAGTMLRSVETISGLDIRRISRVPASGLIITAGMDAMRRLFENLKSSADGDLNRIGQALESALAGYIRRDFLIPIAGGELSMGPGRALIMGVLNVTPDSFSDGGMFLDCERAIRRGLGMLEQGADIIDIGGESTRPGAPPVPPDEQIGRISPVIKGLAEKRAVISVDTASAAVAEQALDLGAKIINDVTALRADPNMARVASCSGAPVILMHMLGTPRTMQKEPRYDDVVADILRFLRERIDAAIDAGIDEERIIVDPGIGFGKTVEHNLEILRRLSEFRSLGRPVLLGTSRKSFIGRLLDRPVEERLMGTAATLALGSEAGASIFRVHDVPEALQVVRMAEYITGRQP